MQVRKFKAVNTGSLGVTFAMDNKAMQKLGFTVSPVKVPLLVGAPAHASLELTVTLQVSTPPMCLPCVPGLLQQRMHKPAIGGDHTLHPSNSKGCLQS